MGLRRKAEKIVLDGHLAVVDHWPEAIHGVVDSQTNPDTFHAVHWKPHTDWTCECPGFTYRHRCSHVEAVKLEIRRRGLTHRNTQRRSTT